MHSDWPRASARLLLRGLARPRLPDIMLVGLMLALTSGLAALLRPRFGEPVVMVLYLVPVLAAAAGLGLQAGLMAAAGAVGLLNFLFAEPHFTFLVRDLPDLVTLLVFLLVAGTTGALAGGLREARDAAETRAELVQILQQSSEQLHAAATRAEVLEIATQSLRRLSRSPVLLLAREGGQLTPAAPGDLSRPLAAEDLQSAEEALRRGLPERAAAQGWNGSAWTFLPLQSRAPAAPGQTPGAVLAHRPPRDPSPDAAEREAAIEALVAQSGLALERLDLAARAQAESARAASGEQRSALLASLSHDLRTPLAVILGGVTTVMEFQDGLTPEARRRLLSNVEQETRRLSHYVDDVLQLTRLQSGAPLRLGWADAAEAARAALSRLRPLHSGAQVTLDLPQLPMIRAEAALLEQALFNLLDNALRYSEGPVALSARVEGRRLHLAVTDGGARAPVDQPHPPVAGPGEGEKGAGLGLQICRAIAAAFGGALELRSLPSGGTRALLDLPLPEDLEPNR